MNNRGRATSTSVNKFLKKGKIKTKDMGITEYCLLIYYEKKYY
jgi:hypothetical protein